MHAHEIIVRKMQRNCGAEVLDLLRERFRQPREPAHAHPHGQILALDQTGRNMRLVRIADDDDGALGADNMRRTVAAPPTGSAS